jgi:hypothetical protein
VCCLCVSGCPSPFPVMVHPRCLFAIDLTSACPLRFLSFVRSASAGALGPLRGLRGRLRRGQRAPVRVAAARGCAERPRAKGPISLLLGLPFSRVIVAVLSPLLRSARSLLGALLWAWSHRVRMQSPASCGCSSFLEN